MEPYIPSPLPLADLKWGRLVKPIAEANAAVARYDGLLQGIVNPSVLLAPLAVQEAQRSARIEGSQVTVEEVYEFKASGVANEKKRDDLQEILNYSKGMQEAVTHLTRRPLSLNLVKELHAELMDRSVRGSNKEPGRFRCRQVFIGRYGAKIEEASYVPPPPASLPGLLGNFESYLHFDERDRLTQLAIIHAQFELIHPFLDGNGRLGRMLVPVFLFEKGILFAPMFYISDYLDKNRDEYIDRLAAISASDDWLGWIEFFLRAVTEQARTNGEKARAILDLYEKMKREVVDLTRSKYATATLDAIFCQPIFETPDFSSRANIPKNMALNILRRLSDARIIAQLREGLGQRPGLFVFNELFTILK
jgi:Fic family protein